MLHAVFRLVSKGLHYDQGQVEILRKVSADCDKVMCMSVCVCVLIILYDLLAEWISSCVPTYSQESLGLCHFIIPTGELRDQSMSQYIVRICLTKSDMYQSNLYSNKLLLKNDNL